MTFRAATLAAVSVLGIALLAPQAVEAQQAAWPQRNVRFIIPFGPGSGADISARVISERLQQKWGQAIVVENRPGGDAMVAINAFVGAKDDHTLLYAAAASFVAHPYQYDTLPYSPEQDLLPIARISYTLMTVAVPTAMNLPTLKDFVAYAKANPGKANSASVQGLSEIIFHGFFKREGLDVSKVPYRDIVQAPTDLAEGRIQVVLASLAAQQPMAQTGKITLLGMGSSRTPLFPNVPTITEAGYPHLDHEGLVGLFGPRGMALELRKKVAADIIGAGSTKEFADRLTGTAQLIALGGPDELTQSITKMRSILDNAAQTLGMKKKL